MTRFNENGRSMVEMIGVIAIIGVISAGGLVGYSRAMYRFQLSKTMSIVTDALQDYKLFVKRGVENYPFGATAATAKQYNLISSCEQDANEPNACKMPLGKLYPNFTTSDDGSSLSYKYDLKVSFEKAQKNACIDFVSRDWNQTVPDRWWYHGGSIRIQSDKNETGQIVYSSNIHHLDVSFVTNACNMVCGEGVSSCDVIFHFEGERY